MNAKSLAFLIVGIGIGFAVVYPWTHGRAPEIAKPYAVLVPDTNAGGPAQGPPPLDTARLKQLEDEVAKDPKKFDAIRELGNMQYDQGNFNEAVKWYQKAAELEPANIEVKTDLGGALFNANRVDESIEQFRKSLEQEPNHPQSLFNLGVALLDGKNDVDGALQAWQLLVDKNPTFPQVALVKQEIQKLKDRQKPK